MRYQVEENGNKHFWCLLTGGTRLLVGLEDQVKERVIEIGKEKCVNVKIATVEHADFATVRGAVLRGIPVSKTAN